MKKFLLLVKTFSSKTFVSINKRNMDTSKLLKKLERELDVYIGNLDVLQEGKNAETISFKRKIISSVSQLNGGEFDQAMDEDEDFEASARKVVASKLSDRLKAQKQEAEEKALADKAQLDEERFRLASTRGDIFKSASK